MRSKMEGMKSIPMCDLFYWMVLDIVRPLTETFSGKQMLLLLLATIPSGVKHVF
jgi:hypothetical protein